RLSPMKPYQQCIDYSESLKNQIANTSLCQTTSANLGPDPHEHFRSQRRKDLDSIHFQLTQFFSSAEPEEVDTRLKLVSSLADSGLHDAIDRIHSQHLSERRRLHDLYRQYVAIVASIEQQAVDLSSSALQWQAQMKQGGHLIQSCSLRAADSDAQDLVRSTMELLGQLAQLPIFNTETIRRLLSVVPRPHLPTFVRLSIDWLKQIRDCTSSHRTSTASHRYCHGLIQELTTLIQRQGVSDAFAAQLDQSLEDDCHFSEPVLSMLEESDLAVTPERYVRVLKMLHYSEGMVLSPKSAQNLPEFCDAIASDERLIELIKAVEQSGGLGDYANSKDIRACERLQPTPAEFSRLIVVVAEDSKRTDAILKIGDGIEEPWVRRSLTRQLCRAESVLVKGVLGWIAALPEPLAIPIRKQFDGVSTDWINRYPEELHDSLRQLATLHSDAFSVAQKILAKDFPNAEADRRELKHLQALVSQANEGPSESVTPQEDLEELRRIGGLKERINNLQERLNNPLQVSSRRLARLLSKLERRIDTELTDRMAQSCLESSQRSFSHELTSFSVVQLRDAMFENGHPQGIKSAVFRQVFAGIIGLRPRMRSIGVRLLAQSFEHPSETTTSDASQHKENKRFLERMADRDIDLEPWLSPGFRHRITNQQQPHYEIAFGRKPFDYLLMGMHFQTCLSPDSFNFFSAVANAVDINKQVLYGKTSDGKIMGRCLVALTDEGEINVFNRYSHDSQWGFADAALCFIKELAERMGTSITDGGSVSPLVSDEWYDDGASGMCELLGIHDSNDALLSLLQNAAPSEILQHVRSQYPQVTTQKFIELLLPWHSDAKIAELLSYLGTDWMRLVRPVGLRLRMILVFLQDHSAEQDVPQHLPSTRDDSDCFPKAIQPVFRSISQRALRKLFRNSTCGDPHCDTFHGLGSIDRVSSLLLKMPPTLGLQMMRASRPRSIRSDQDESNRNRRRILQRLYIKTGRSYERTAPDRRAFSGNEE
ncbi:MAG: hypothetical protein AAF989_12725, partial [Planctomycetota bacterium]